MIRSILFAGVIALCVAWSAPASAMYLFVDTNGDGVWTSADRLQKDRTTKVDIWLQTDQGRGGAPALEASASRTAPFFSYQLVLGASGGQVRWGDYVNAQPSMNTSFGRIETGTELSVGFGGETRLPPGRYRLGTLTVSVVSGTPSLDFRSHGSTLEAETALGSMSPGKNDDHTLRLAVDGSGDWADADGAGPGTSRTSEGPSAALRFAVRMTPNPGRSGDLHLSVTTTKPGVVNARLFDLQGKLVRTIVSNEEVGAGTRSFDLSLRQRPLARGIYLYRVDGPDGTASGRVTVLP